MSYSHNQELIYAFVLNATTNPLAILEVDLSYGIKSTMAKYQKYAGDLYYNHSQNLILDLALQALGKQKEFSGATIKKFVKTFRVQIAKIVEVIKASKKKKIRKTKLVNVTS